MIEMQTVKTVGDLERLLGQFDPTTPVVWAEGAISDLHVLEAGELRVSGVTHLALLEGGEL